MTTNPLPVLADLDLGVDLIVLAIAGNAPFRGYLVAPKYQQKIVDIFHNMNLNSFDQVPENFEIPG